jgi:hypothetical protein
MPDICSDGSTGVAQVRALHDADTAGSTEALSVLITSHLWITWLNVAIERVHQARSVRDKVVLLAAEGQNISPLLGLEFEASVVAVAASASALDALYGSAVIPANARDHGTNRPGKIREALKHVFDTGQVNTVWVGEFNWLFDLRDAAVHAGDTPPSPPPRRPRPLLQAPKPPAPHPIAGSAAQELSHYSVDSAERAVKFALSVFRWCVDHPRPKDPNAPRWAAEMLAVIEELEQRGPGETS